MPALFDGMASLINDVFGDPVIYVPKGGEARVIQSIFREMPTEAVDEDGHGVIITSPSWRVRRADAPEAKRGDRIEAPNGRFYTVLNVSPSGSPAADAMIICELERFFTT